MSRILRNFEQLGRYRAIMHLEMFCPPKYALFDPLGLQIDAQPPSGLPCPGPDDRRGAPVRSAGTARASAWGRDSAIRITCSRTWVLGSRAAWVRIPRRPVELSTPEAFSDSNHALSSSSGIPSCRNEGPRRSRAGARPAGGPPYFCSKVRSSSKATERTSTASPSPMVGRAASAASIRSETPLRRSANRLAARV